MLSDVLRCFERGCRGRAIQESGGFFLFFSFISVLVSLVRRRGFGFGSVDVGSEETSCKKWSSGRSEFLLDLVLVLE